MPDRLTGQPAAGAAPKGENIEAQRTVLLLNTQAASMRSELAQLRQSLADAQRELTTHRSALLQEANQKLVLAALHAENIANAALASLGELSRTMQRDTLTDTPNRAVALDRIELAITLARRHGTQVAVLLIDVDDFKKINDTLGHAIGDATLQLVARRLESAVRTSDTVSRQGKDEFLVLVPELSQTADAQTVADKIRAAFSSSAEVGGHALDLSVSIGIAVYPVDGHDVRTLIDRADAARRHGKDQPERSARVADKGAIDRRDTAVHTHVIAPTPEVREVQRAEESLQMHHLRQANEQLVLGAMSAQEIQDRAETRYQQQVRFIAIVAHELRNPLNPIRNAAELLKRSRGDQTLLDNLQGIIERQVVHMTRLIDDLLDGSKAGVGKLQLQCAPVNILEVLSVVVDACRPAMQARHQHFTTDLPPGPLHLQADHFRLAQVFSNLLDNASKYTPDGGSIKLSLAKESDAVVVTVADDGFGITPNSLYRIFDLFEQDERALALQNHGLGIGLAVVRDLVEAHGGSVVATSPGVGRGSRFVVSLPLGGPGRFAAPVSGTA